MKQDKSWGKKLAFFIMAFSAFWLVMMALIDYFAPWLGKVPHHISGAIWFQLISSWLLALPSIGICAYAVLQTDRNRKLDDERLCPELLMKSAEISMGMIKWTGFDQWVDARDDIGEQQRDEYKRYRQKHSRVNEDEKENNNLGYLVFKSDLLLKGGESVIQIIISQIIVQIGGCQYLMRFADAIQGDSKAGVQIFFDKSYKNGQEEYHIEWQPDYKSIEVENEIGVWNVIKDEENFWNDVYNAVVDPEYDTDRKGMEWRIFLNIEYGINKSQCKKEPVDAEWRIRWNGDKREAINDYMSKQCSYEGILSVG